MVVVKFFDGEESGLMVNSAANAPATALTQVHLTH